MNEINILKYFLDSWVFGVFNQAFGDTYNVAAVQVAVVGGYKWDGISLAGDVCRSLQSSIKYSSPDNVVWITTIP